MRREAGREEVIEARLETRKAEKGEREAGKRVGAAVWAGGRKCRKRGVWKEGLEAAKSRCVISLWRCKIDVWR